MASADQASPASVSTDPSRLPPAPPFRHRPRLSSEFPSPSLGRSHSRQATVGEVPRMTPRSFSPGAADHSTSTDPDAKKLAMSPEATDRVFPVRSVVSMDPTATPTARADSEDGFPGMVLPKGNDKRRERLPKDEVISNQPSPERSSVPPRPARRSSSPQSPRPLSRPSPPQEPDSERVTEADADKRLRRGAHQELNTLMAGGSSAKSDGDSTADGLSTTSKPDSIRSVPESAHLPLTARFKHIVTDGGHAVVTGRDGETLQRCEDEPIHIPGAIQSFGLLIVFREEAENLVVRVVSENSTKLIGYTPQQLFQLPSFLNILTEDQADNLLDHLDFIRDESGTDPAVHGPEVFMLSIRTARRKPLKFWCAIHISGPDKDLIVCELELEDDIHNPLVAVADATPEPPEDTMGCEPTAEEFAESTVNASRPLRVLRSARKKRGEAAAMEVFNIMAQVQEQLADAPDLPRFLKILIGVVKELTGFHRAMIYQFDQACNGRVVSELVDPRATKDFYMGLNFPASDIPKQARELYRLNKVRLLYDRDQETARLVCRTAEDLEQPLDMTFAYLRAMSPIHLKYLANMAVKSSMSISINAFGELWGLIACHSYGQRGTRVSFPIRKMCRLIGDSASRNIERLSYASRLQARKLINTACTNENPSGYIVASSDDLLSLFSADFGALSIRDETRVLGKVDGKADGNLQELLAMLEFLRLRKIASVFASSNIATDFPDLRYPPGFQLVAGLLFVPLSSSGADFIVFFRKGSLKEVKWAGNPYEKFVNEGTGGYLEPRKSFRTWSETVVGTCREWTEEEVETAAVLCLVYGKFIEVWRQKEAALQNSQLQRILLANSAHEVRTPLNAIINYLEIALEGNLDQETRDNLTRSHSASKSLVYVINDLLDLTKTEQGLDLVKDETFDFHTMLQEATEPFKGDAQRKGIDYSVTIFDEIPQHLCGDPRRLRQVISNVIANAIENTSAGRVVVEVCKSMEQSGEDDDVEIEFAVEDTGAGMPQEKVDALFRELEQVSSESEAISSAIVGKDRVSQSSETEANGATLGLGLAVVARAVRNMNGQLRLRTREGRGSLFVIQLTMGLPSPVGSVCGPGEDQNKDSIAAPPESSTATQGKPVDAPPPVSRKATERVRAMSASRTASQEGANSLKSRNSAQSVGSGNSDRSAKRDVDRLIDDIQKPHLLTELDRNELRRSPVLASNKPHKACSTADEPSGTSITSNHLTVRSPDKKIRGGEAVTSSRTPVKAVRIPDDEVVNPQGSALFRSPSKVAFQLGGRMSDQRSDSGLGSNAMSILVAEDDPVNSKIMKKRLEKLGHRVHLTVNGEECYSSLGDQSSCYDVVLMDLQMPIVDGFTSTKMIRSFEKGRPRSCLSARAKANGRIPIFAVSASLVEKNRTQYMEHGFDGWILKPVNFQRVDGLLKGIVEEERRNACLYQPGQWEHGGWFEKRRTCSDVSAVNTAPSGRPPALEFSAPAPSSTKSETF